jgi:hypothetical protein
VEIRSDTWAMIYLLSVIDERSGPNNAETRQK